MELELYLQLYENWQLYTLDHQYFGLTVMKEIIKLFTVYINDLKFNSMCKLNQGTYNVFVFLPYPEYKKKTTTKICYA